MTYNITKHFTSGLLKGLTISEITSVRFETGRTYKGSMGSSSYVVVSVVAV